MSSINLSLYSTIYSAYGSQPYNPNMYIVKSVMFFSRQSTYFETIIAPLLLSCLYILLSMAVLARHTLSMCVLYAY